MICFSGTHDDLPRLPRPYRLFHGPSQYLCDLTFEESGTPAQIQVAAQYIISLCLFVSGI